MKDSSQGIRDSRWELYRIILMLFLVANHYRSGSQIAYLLYKHPYNMESAFTFILAGWGKTIINSFVLLTGFFMCEMKIKVKKFFIQFAEVLFYNVIFFLIFIISGYWSPSVDDIVNLFPINKITNNYSSCYLAFYLLIPFVNILIKNLDKNRHELLILLLLFYSVIIGSIPKFGITINYIYWFFILYLVGAYVKIYDGKQFLGKAKWGGIFIVSFSISIISIFVCCCLSHEEYDRGYQFLSDSNKIFAFSTAFALFIFFKNLKLKYNRTINWIASSTFGVLLIHANSDAMRSWLWGDFLRNVYYFELGGYQYILHFLFSVIGIFTISVFIDKLRVLLVEKPIIEKIWMLLERKHNGVIRYIEDL